MQIPKNLVTTDSTTLKWLQVVVYGGVILYFSRDILIPISFALLISFILYPICVWLEKKGTGRLTAIILSISFLMMIGLLVVALLIYQFVQFLDEWPSIQTKFVQTASDLRGMIEILGISRENQQALLSRLSSGTGNHILDILRAAISMSAFSIVLSILIPVYAILILYYRHYWMKILQRVFPSENNDSLREMVALTIKAYYDFIKGMAIVYIAVGGLNSIGLLLLGVPHAILFGFIASVLTFIPYVGIIVGSLLPITMAWITYDSIWYPIGIVGVFTFVQYLEANLIFPVAVSNRLNVNTLAMLVAIFAGGIVWGVAGMILFVPFAGILKLIADHNPKWKTASLILGVDSKK